MQHTSGGMVSAGREFCRKQMINLIYLRIKIILKHLKI